jgi:putative membrane protein
MTMKTLKTAWTLPLAMLVALAGSARAHGEDKAAAAGPTDAQIAHIAVTANQIDVDAGNQALTRAQSAEVKKFAQLMVTDHTSVIKQASDLAGKLKLTPEDNDTSKTLSKNAADTAAKMKALSGAEFDKAYVANEVAFHRAVLDALDKVLIPNAKNAELKKLLTSARPVIAMHLGHAEHLSKTLTASR